MTTKHTPGPWTAVEQRSGSIQVQHALCTVAIIPPTTLSEYQANARLIAAAPEMLEVLKTIIRLNPGSVYINYGDKDWDASNPGGMYQEFYEAAALIARIEGDIK